MFYSQHDAHEFLIYLLEGLNEEVNRIQEKKKRYIDCSNEVETIRYCHRVFITLKAFK